jgi:hypothetical protein
MSLWYFKCMNIILFNNPVYFRSMHPLLKHYLKKYILYFKIAGRFSREEKSRQADLVASYKRSLQSGQLPQLSHTGFKLFSQFEEDGLLLFIFSLIKNPVTVFLEFGSDDGVNSNSANLHFHHNWTGLFIDGNPKAIERGQYFYRKHGNKKVERPVFLNSIITRENINELIRNGGLHGEIGLLSIDIDGNDYWVWENITAVNPQVVIIETHNEFGLHDIVVPYDPDYFYPGKHPDYHGASPVAMTNLAKSKGYRLIGANELGFNFIFVRNDLIPELPEVSVESCLLHPSNIDAQRRFEAIKNWDYMWNRTFEKDGDRA